VEGASADADCALFRARGPALCRIAAGDAAGSLVVLSLETAEVMFNRIFTAPATSALSKPERLPIVTLNLTRTYIGDYGAPSSLALPVARRRAHKLAV